MIYDHVFAIVLHLSGQSDYFVAKSGYLDITAEMFCKFRSLHPETLTEEDVNIAWQFQKEVCESEYNKSFRPWHVDRFWDDMKQRLFEMSGYITENWKEPSDGHSGKSLAKLTEEIVEYRKQLEEAIIFYAWLCHEIAKKNGRPVPVREQIIDYILRSLNDDEKRGSDYTLVDVESLYEQFIEGKDLSSQFAEFSKELEEGVSRDTTLKGGDVQ